jgi:hypothetical protein
MELETNTSVVAGAALASSPVLWSARPRIARCRPRRSQVREVPEREVSEA